MSGSKLRTFLSISAVLGVVIVFHFLGWLHPIEQFLRHIVNPASQKLYTISVALDGGEETFATTDDLKQAYRLAQQQLTAARVDRAELDLLHQENDELRSQLHFISQKTYTTLGAEVIGKNIEPLGSTIVINRGQKDEIGKGNPVIMGEGIIVGRVMRVEETTAIVQLINDHQSKLIATTLNKEKSIGVVEGGFGISVRLNFVPQNETLHVGDSIVTSGLDDGIPRGLLIGTVEAVEKEAYQPFQRAIITPAASLDKLSLVSIITNVATNQL